MNIGWMYCGLLALEGRSKTLRGNLKEQQFRSFFPSFFQNLTLTERHVLKALGKYDYLIAVFDRLNAGATFSYHEINEIKAILTNAVNLKNTLKANGFARPEIAYNSSLNVIFPVCSTEDNTAVFKDEVYWFFDGIQKSLSIFENIDNEELTILNVQNEVLSIAVAVDWKMVLIVAWLIKEHQVNRANTQSDKTALSHLKGRGVKNETINDIERQLEVASNAAETNNLIAKLKNLFADLSTIKLRDDWESSVRLLIKRVREGLARGYKIEAEIKNYEKLDDIENVEKLNEVKKLVQYDRDIDDQNILGDRLKIEQTKSEKGS